ncbi:ATP-grasp domain-containing protein [Ensifer sp. SSB1]|uniref:ATP-grasp domain-containing protein n=1 Tax=Ensifer sp. SSB1 TaxID=2795385 RepID=UPI001A6372D9|nr:ATP-grasp domain-containing protein [Ensifer sp. SSB1]MBK5570908.1 ATP-grasp domain-containing protein [Ensifer sp. SSB1]
MQDDAKQSKQPVTVVVTAVGAIIGQGIVASLRRLEAPIRIIGIDRDANGIGRHFCDDFVAKPSCDEASPEYLEFWLELLRREDVALVLPGLELDVLFFNDNRARFEATETRVVLNRSPLIALAQDKWDMGEALLQADLPAIPSTLSRSLEDCTRELGPLPLLLKPRRGNGSRGIALLRDRADFDYWTLKSADDFLIQKFVGSNDQEYTVGAFGFGDGTTLPPIVFKRKLSVAGNTQYAEVVDEPFLTEAVSRLSQHFKPLGPTNYQFRLEGTTPYLLEINPRFSSSTSLRAAFGYNEAAMALEYYVYGRKPEAPEIKTGRAWRYSEDLVVL